MEQLVSTNVPGNIHHATEWINCTGLARYVIHLESSGNNSIAVFKVPADKAPAIRKALGQIPESLANPKIWKEFQALI